MISVIYSSFWIIVSCWLVNWKEWKKYYPTALFAAVANLLYEVICSKYQLWSMEPNGLPNHTLNILLLSIIGMPISTMIYLSNYPFNKSLFKQVLYTSIFIIGFTIMEYIAVKFGSITYHHGWTLFHSFLFDISIFVILFIHFKYPIWAWVLSTIVIFIVLINFNIGLDKMN